jgi:hypothetical protein
MPLSGGATIESLGSNRFHGTPNIHPTQAEVEQEGTIFTPSDDGGVVSCWEPCLKGNAEEHPGLDSIWRSSLPDD